MFTELTQRGDGGNKQMLGDMIRLKLPFEYDEETLKDYLNEHIEELYPALDLDEDQKGVRYIFHSSWAVREAPGQRRVWLALRSDAGSAYFPKPCFVGCGRAGR